MSKVLDAEQCVLVDVEPVVAAPKAPVDKTFRRYDQDQPLLLPPDLRDWLPAEHPARMVDDLVEFGLDLAGIYASYTESRGAPPYDPRLMLKVLIYGYSNGVTSSRALERRCQDDIAFRFLTADAAPDFVAISRFRVRHGAALKALFTQSLALCGRAWLVSLGRVALDGTKVRAAASRHRAMSYDRMVRAEAELEAEVATLLADAEAVDAAEDAAYGADRRADELPAELAAAARARAQEEARGRGDGDEQVAAAGAAAATGAVVPDKAQRSFTDPDARIMKTSDGSFHYCFNGQAIVDEAHQVILAGQLRQSGADCPALPDMLTELETFLREAGIDGAPNTLLGDAGYFSAANVEAFTDTGIDPLLATGRLKHGERAAPAPRGPIPKNATVKQRMARKLRTKKAKADYARRKVIVEPVFGQLQTCQTGDQLRLRGKPKADVEWFFHLACHNFRKLFNSHQTPWAPPTPVSYTHLTLPTIYS